VSLDYAILGFLQSGEMSGYDLKTRCFDRQASHYWTADQAQVYRTLDRLELAGDVTVARKRQRSRPDRKVYSITPSGEARLLAWAAEPHPLPPHRDPFLIQLRFSTGLTNTTLAETLEARRVEHQSRLEGLRSQRARLEGSGEMPRRDARLQEMTLEAAIASERAAIDWLDDCLEIASDIPRRRGGSR
jgi:DNA-binding PadR family transcriptional regulator